MELIIVTFVSLGVGFVLREIREEIKKTRTRREWTKAGRQWSQIYEKAVESKWTPPKFSPEDSFVKSILERTRPMNVLPEHEQKEHALRIQEMEKAHKKQKAWDCRVNEEIKNRQEI